MSTGLFEMYKRDFGNFNNEFLTNIESGDFFLDDKLRTVYRKDEAEYFKSIQTKHYVSTRNKWGLLDEEKELFFTEGLYFSSQTQFEFYLHADEQRCKDIISSFKRSITLFFGGLSSIGYNGFKFIDATSSVELKGTPKLLLSNALVVPAQINFHDSQYLVGRIDAVFANAIAPNKLRTPLVVFKEGSIIATKETTIGDLVSEVVDGKEIYQYAIGLLI